MEKILIIEDEYSVARIMSYDLTKEGYQVEIAHDGLQGLQLGLNGHFDLILVDWMLPSISGIDIIKKLREANINSIIIIASAKSDELDVVQGLETGADDYIRKPFSSRELLARIQAHLRRVVKKDQKITVINDVVVDYARHIILVNNQVIDVTKKEFELFDYLIKNENIALSRDQILLSIWGYNYDGDTRIVDVHIFKLRDKLKDGKVQIRTVRGIGYCLERLS